MNRDPIGEEGGVNIQVYCSNDPFDGVDPMGMDDGRWLHIFSGEEEIASESEIVFKHESMPSALLGRFEVGVGMADAIPAANNKQQLCKAKIYVSITINTEVPSSPSFIPENVVRFGYKKHVKGNDGLGKIAGHTSSGEQVQYSIPGEVVEAHEVAHAKAFFEFVNAQEATLNLVGGLIPDGDLARNIVWAFLLGDDYLVRSAKLANDATIERMGYIYTPETATTIGSSTYHKTWRRP